jgi:hypothetical protein
MGIFSSKKKTSVDTQVVRIIEREHVPETLMASVLRAVVGSRASMGDTIVEGLYSSPARSFEKMHKYGRTTYTHGLPNTDLIKPSSLTNIVQGVINVLEGRTVTIDYARFGVLNNSHYARMVLTNQHGYDTATNEVTAFSAQKKAKVYVRDIVPAYTVESFEEADPEIFDEVFGDPESGGYSEDEPMNEILGQFKQYTAPEITTFEGARVILTWKEGAVSKTQDLIINMQNEDLDADYYQVRYRYTQSGKTVIKYWTYRSGAGQYPTLDMLHDPGFKGSGTYFPFVFFRSRKENLAHPSREGTALHKTSTKLLEHIGIDYTDLGKEINDNPDVGQIEQAVLMMGVRADSKDPIEVRYLFEYFRNIAVLAGARVQAETSATRPTSIGGLFSQASLSSFNTTGSGARAITLKDRDFKQVLSMSNVQRKVIAGRIGIEGTYSSYRAKADKSLPVQGGLFRRKETPILVYRKQITASTYEEVWVYNLALKYDIWEGHSVTAKIGEDRLLIPIDLEIAKSLPIHKREKLYTTSLHLVFNSRVTQKVKWYQRGAFKVVLIIAAIAITAYTGRFEAIALAIKAGQVLAAVIAIVTEIVVALAMQEGFKFVAKELGADIAMYLAIAAILYGGFDYLASGSLEASMATQMLTVSAGFANASGNEYMRMAQDYQGQLQAFNLLAEQQFKELEDIRKSLETITPLNPYEFVGMQPFIVLGETPDNFYQRTVHSGNIGAKAIDAVTNYAEIALRLPTPQDTLGGVVYV